VPPGIRVVEVDRSGRQDRPRQGKSDPRGQRRRAAQSGRAAGAPKGRDGTVEAIRALMVAKRSAAGRAHPDDQPGQGRWS
jgi:transposase